MKALNAAFLTPVPAPSGAAAGAGAAALCGLVDYLCTRMLIEKVARLLGRLLAYL